MRNGEQSTANMRGPRLTCLVLLALSWAAGTTRAGAPPPWLPRYDLDIHLDTAQRLCKVRQRVTWTNRHNMAVGEIVFNAHAHYTIPDKEIGFLAKTLEVLRLSPSEAMSFDGPALEVQTVHLIAQGPPSFAQEKKQGPALKHGYLEDNPTALVVALQAPLEPNEAVTLELDFTVKIPPKKGRWGQWGGITTLAQWLPVVAVHDAEGWHPAPFIPWHQPFYNEAGFYSVGVTLPADQKLACSSMIQETQDLGQGWHKHVIAPACLRDFALIASSLFEEHEGKVGDTKIRVLALPEHAWYAKETVKIVKEAIPVYNKWLGPYPYPQFTVVEAYFGWNGNECGSLVMIDQRMFGMPHMARAYIDYLVSHELCHQWWYNVIGTHGYAETWMDEGMATYFSHRLINDKLGKDNKLLEFPRGLEWLPNITRDDFRNSGLIGVRARGQTQHATVQDMPKFSNLVNLSAYTYDRGSKIVGMIEERLGEAAFLDFIRAIYQKYQFQILRVADFQRELEAFTGRSWQDFFQHWLHSGGMCDWSVEKVEIEGSGSPQIARPRWKNKEGVKAVVTLKQKGGFNEPTVLGFRFGDGEGYQLRIPILPDAAVLQLDDCAAKVECWTINEKEATVRVEIHLAREPAQISVDPDRILLDSKPTNNHWKPAIRWRLAPLYTQMEETDVTNSWDKWNVIAGPWIYGAAYNDPWFARSPLAGARVSVYRTQDIAAGAFVAYRSNDRSIVAGADALWDHVPLPNTQVGLTVERSLTVIGSSDDNLGSRGVLFGRYILLPSSSLYLPPFEYVEAFGTVGHRNLIDPRTTPPGADPFNERTGIGIHYHKNYMTPYWDAEAGIAIDLTYEGGLPVFGSEPFHQVFGQVAVVKHTPKMEWLGDHPLVDWLRDTRWAFRLGGAAGIPLRGQFFALGGAELFRGFDPAERQGSLTWVGSIEWRIPIVKDVCWDVCDHVAGIRNVYLAPFYDVGDAYVTGHSLGPVAHAFGAGIRVDVAWLGLIERTILRFDVAKTVGGNAPVQFWFGVQHPF